MGNIFLFKGVININNINLLIIIKLNNVNNLWVLKK